MLEKPVHQISLQDLNAFIAEQHRESSWLDYKRECSDNKQVAKIVSAMANAHGGWVFVGVAEAGKKPKERDLPGAIVGVPSGTASKIKQICLDAINPPVVPEVSEIYLDDKKEKCVVLVRVFESESTPHEIETGVYIRTNDISHLADDGRRGRVEEIEMLLNRRSKASELKDDILAQVNGRHINYGACPKLTIRVIPLYPDRPVASHEEIYSALSKTVDLVWFEKQMRIISAYDSVYAGFQRIGQSSFSITS